MVSRYSSREAAGKEKKSGKARKDIHVLLSFTRYKAKKEKSPTVVPKVSQKGMLARTRVQSKVRYFLPTFFIETRDLGQLLSCFSLSEFPI